mgnify:CR=1 FL=1
MDGKVRINGWQCKKVFVNGKVRVCEWQSENTWMAK